MVYTSGAWTTLARDRRRGMATNLFGGSSAAEYRYLRTTTYPAHPVFLDGHVTVFNNFYQAFEGNPYP